MKIPYIKIRQRSETFFVTKIKAVFLKDHINFHFRDPYFQYKKSDSMDKASDYLNQLAKRGIELKSSPEGIQRRLQIGRINEIKDYLSSSNNNFFPNSILLAADVSKIDDFDNEYFKYEQQETGYFDLPDTIRFTVIDGQHRLAGLFTSEEKLISEFELVAILLFNVSISTAAKLFADINGKQKPVNRSLIYDLYEEIETVELHELKRIHGIAEKFYTNDKSPLYRQIKMLGIGNGAISQAFFIDYTLAALKKANIDDKITQEIYNHLFLYFRAFQKVFPEDWPVPLGITSVDELDRFADEVLIKKRSQLAKTNGFGAILRLFPEVYHKANGNSANYFDIISLLRNKIKWVEDPNSPQGTGKKFQNYLYERMRELIFR